jgi:hypothetical protein
VKHGADIVIIDIALEKAEETAAEITHFEEIAAISR